MEGVDVGSHKAPRVHLGKVFIRHGNLPDDTAAFVETLYKDRLRADYELASFSRGIASEKIAEVRTRMDQFAGLL